MDGAEFEGGVTIGRSVSWVWQAARNQTVVEASTTPANIPTVDLTKQVRILLSDLGTLPDAMLYCSSRHNRSNPPLPSWATLSKPRKDLLPPKVYSLLNLQAPFGGHGLKIPQRHFGIHVPELVLERLGMPIFLQPCNGPTVPQHVDRPHVSGLGDPCGSEGLLDYLMHAHPSHGEEWLVGTQADPIGVGLQVGRQGSAQGHLAKLVPLAHHRGHPTAAAGPG